MWPCQWKQEVVMAQRHVAALQHSNRPTGLDQTVKGGADDHALVWKLNKDEGEKSSFHGFHWSSPWIHGGVLMVCSAVPDPQRCCKPILLNWVFGTESSLWFLLTPEDGSFLFDNAISVCSAIFTPALSLPVQFQPQLHDQNLRKVLGPLTLNRRTQELQDV